MWRKSFCIYGNLVSRSIECKLKPQIPYISFVNKYCTNKSSSGNVESETGFKKVQQNHNWVSRFKTKLSDSTKQLTEKAESEENNDDTLSIEDNLAPRILYAVPNEKWTPIYRYDSIRLMSVLSNLKYYQVYCSVIAIAGVGFGEFCGLFEPNATAAVGVGVLTAQAAVFLVGAFTSGIVGVIYIDPEIKTVRISYLDFWGRRKDEEVPINELIFPKKELLKYAKFFLPLKATSNKSIYNMSFNGTVLEPNIFEHIFGAYRNPSNDDDDEKFKIAPRPVRRRPRYGSFR